MVFVLFKEEVALHHTTMHMLTYDNRKLNELKGCPLFPVSPASPKDQPLGHCNRQEAFASGEAGEKGKEVASLEDTPPNDQSYCKLQW